MTERVRHSAISRLVLILFVASLAGLATPAATRAAPEGQLTWAVHVTLAPTWFDPAETTGIITPFLFLYALHDALVKPMPGNPMAPSLADRKSTRLNSSHLVISYAVFCLKKKRITLTTAPISSTLSDAGD